MFISFCGVNIDRPTAWSFYFLKSIRSLNLNNQYWLNHWQSTTFNFLNGFLKSKMNSEPIWMLNHLNEKWFSTYLVNILHLMAVGIMQRQNCWEITLFHCISLVAICGDCQYNFDVSLLESVVLPGLQRVRTSQTSLPSALFSEQFPSTLSSVPSGRFVNYPLRGVLLIFFMKLLNYFPQHHLTEIHDE